MADEVGLEFDWDESNLRHLARHRISREEFEEAMTNDPVYLGFSDETGGDRWYVLGATSDLRVWYLVFTVRDQRVRPVTGWDAKKKLREMYFRQKGL
ncbi:MAG: BrnT family toxin [Acidobacteria bacterium]|nr:MAG: BrnT family toxin [Acidobacteriota bacterium]